MLSIVFGYNGSSIMMPYLAGGSCNYSTIKNRFLKVSEEQDFPAIEYFLEQKDPNRYMGLVYNLRIPKMDIPEFTNGNAYTCVGLQFIDSSNRLLQWVHLRHTLSSLQELRTYSEIPHSLLDYVEANVWKYLGKMKLPIRYILNKLLLHVSLEVAEKLYHPDYVWRTGPNKGKKTMNILLERSGLPPIY